MFGGPLGGRFPMGVSMVVAFLAAVASGRWQQCCFWVGPASAGFVGM